MRRITIAGLCLVAAFVMSALVAGTASATSPEYKACIKVTSGAEFSDKGCSTPVGGGGKGYKLGEWNQGKKTTFKSKASKPIQYLVNPIEEKTVGNFEASSVKGQGEVTGPKTSTFVESFKGVKSLGKNCNSPGQGKGKIVTNKLEGTLIPLGGGKVGELIKPAAGEILAEFNCEGVEVKAKGAVLAEVTGLSGPASKTFHVTVSSRGGNPNHLQEFMYVGGTGTEAEEDKAVDFLLQFVPQFKDCVEDVGDLEDKPGEVAECEAQEAGDFFGEEGELPAKPITILSEVGPPISATLPAGQNGSSEVKGEATKIV